MNFDEFLKKQKYQVEDIKYPIKKYMVKDNYVSLYLEKEKISVSLDDYVEYSISSLKGLDDKLYEILKENEKYLLAYMGCLRKLSMKDYSVKQIKDYLKKYELSEEQFNRLTDSLKSKGYLDDDKYCKNRIMYLKETLLSNVQIRNKLMKEGISSIYIDRYLDHSSQKDKTVELVKKYNKSIRNKSTKSKKQAIASKLMSVGFSKDDVNYALNEINVSQDNEDALLVKEFEKAKRKYEKKNESYDLRNKIIQSLMMKGFEYENIKSLIDDKL